MSLTDSPISTTVHCRRNGDPFNGFTLIEVLVVIAIIAILATLLLPGLTGAKATAIHIKCKSNTRQIGIALAQYAEEHGAYPPFAFDAGGKLDPYAWWRRVGLNPQLTVEGDRFPALRCPGPGSRDPAILAASQSSGRSYGYNHHGFWTFGTKDPYYGLAGKVGLDGLPTSQARPGDVRKPVDMIAAGDNLSRQPDGSVGDNEGGVLHRLEGLVQDSAPPHSSLWTALAKSAAARHRSRANIVFCDGHAETIKFKPLFKDYSPTTLGRWNLDYDPHR